VRKRGRKRRRVVAEQKIKTSKFGLFFKRVILLEETWVYQETLDKMYAIIKQVAKQLGQNKCVFISS
jgi:hypothetical protein